MDQFEEFNNQFERNQKDICIKLCGLINQKLKNATSKMYHGAPVWFIDENPIVGYSKKKNKIALLFLSGQSFSNKGLSPIGKFKAAEKVYIKIEEINENEISMWLEEASSIQWDYKNIRINNGELRRI